MQNALMSSSLTLAATTPLLQDPGDRRSLREVFPLSLLPEQCDAWGREPEPGELLGVGLARPVGPDRVELACRALLPVMCLAKPARVAGTVTLRELTGARLLSTALPCFRHGSSLSTLISTDGLRKKSSTLHPKNLSLFSRP
jgi:hypothetical protein